MPKQYRKKPVVIEAEYFDSHLSAAGIAAWCGGEAREFGGRIGVEIETLEGTMAAFPGDFIIKGTHGEFYPCKAGIFRETYEQL